MIPFHSLVPMARVGDVAASIAFYERLGFAVDNTFTPSGASEPAWAWLRSGGAHLMLTRGIEAAASGGQHGVVFYLYVGDVAAKHAELREAGVDVSDIRFEFYAPKGEFRVTDPDGYAVMITHT